MNEVKIETERLILRMWREEDLESYAEMCADPEVMRYLASKPMTKSEAWRNMAMVIGHWHLRGFGMFAVEERATRELVGRVGPWLPDGWPGLEVGWSLRSKFWGRGFATEAARASINYAFTELDQPHVISLIHPENAASIRVAERLGETVEGATEIVGVKVRVYGIDRER